MLSFLCSETGISTPFDRIGRSSSGSGNVAPALFFRDV